MGAPTPLHSHFLGGKMAKSKKSHLKVWTELTELDSIVKLSDFDIIPAVFLQCYSATVHFFDR